ncbi:type III secretion protein [Pseudomonas fluorescens]|uniref:type III secretion protein n=1 Tax=Pseudomonas fluorescens TaxID=294 RepID=UPI001FCEA459|nr:type III secretion protein [Pseudomonas fluorescens]
MSEHLAWAQWWAFPWKYAHADWKGDDYAAVNALYRSQRLAPESLTGFATCLPPAPHSTVVRLALASTEQLDLTLTLVHYTFNPEAENPLSDSHHLWCVRLSKALPPAKMAPDTDPLQLLHSWLEPAIWQRLRLRFSRKRVFETETTPLPLENGSGRLNTLWQAVVWRVTTIANSHMAQTQTGEEISDAMQTHY